MMKKDKISERDLKALLGLGMLLMVGLAYFIGFQVLLSSAREIKSENMQLETRLQDLQAKYANKDAIQKETEEYNAKIDEIVALFPSKVTTEKVLYDLVGLSKNLGKMQYNSVKLEMNGLFYPTTDGSATATTDTTQGADSTAASDTETAETGTSKTPGYSDGVITVYKSKITTQVKNLSYSALKTLIEEVHNYDGRLTIESLNLSFSKETGLLEGEIVFDFYALEGSPNEYKVPDISGIPSGLKNIFGTFDKE